MPSRSARRPADLERLARILGADEASERKVPELEAADLEAPGRESPGWVPSPPGGDGAVTSAVRRLSRRATEDDEVARLDADLRRARRPALLSVPDELRFGRRAVSSAALVSLLALVVAVGCAFVLRVLWAERTATGTEVAPGPSRSVHVDGRSASAATVPALGSTGASGTGESSGTTGGGAAAPTGGVEVVVHVVGQVVRPGLVRLRLGARVADAIQAAGGTKRGADLSALNLARLVVDGEQVRVPRPGEPVGETSGGTSAGGAPSRSGAPSPLVSLNSADVAALDTLPGVGPVLAQRILDWRAEHGRFTSVDELGEVSGIGDKLMAQLRPKVTL